MPDIFEQLLPIFIDVFDDDELLIYPSTSAKDVDGWDSLAQIRLIVSIEKFFQLRFSAAEIEEIQNVGEMADLIKNKQSDV
jgi:acyl carrier protein